MYGSYCFDHSYILLPNSELINFFASNILYCEFVVCMFTDEVSKCGLYIERLKANDEL